MARNGISFVDLLEAFRNQEKMPKDFAKDIWHRNEEDHECIAKQLQGFVLGDSDIEFTGEE